MPTGYAGEGKRYDPYKGRWIKKSKEQAFDYDNVNEDGATFAISFFRAFPDYFADLCRSENADYNLELPQRFMLRLFAHYKDVYITGVRGLTKTYTILLAKCIEGILYPGEKMRYIAPDQKQASALATQAFHQIEKDYPIIASHWMIRNDRTDMFRITTKGFDGSGGGGSEFTIYAPRGDNSSQTIAEELAAEGSGGSAFDMAKYEKDVLGKCRFERKVNQHPDRTHIDLKHSHISNASSRQNPAYSKYRWDALKKMITGSHNEAYVVDIPWEVALICNIRNINYIEDMRGKLTPLDWEREMCAHYTGTSENPVVTDEDLAKSRQTLMCMEDKHCGKSDVIYVISQDVSYAGGKRNAKIGRVAIKLTQFKEVSKRHKYLADVIYVDGFAPQGTTWEQAQDLKGFWKSYCMDDGGATYLALDFQGGYGQAVAEQLVLPSPNGERPLGIYQHQYLQNLEQPNAVCCIVAIKSGGYGVKTPESEMLYYAQREFEQGNVRLLTPRIPDGIQQYRDRNGVKDVMMMSDGKIALPYQKTEELCHQIKNLQVVLSGASLKEVQRSKYINRDTWSALKYGLWVKKILEDELKKNSCKTQSSWEREKERFMNGGMTTPTTNTNNSTRSHLIGLRNPNTRR